MGTFLLLWFFSLHNIYCMLHIRTSNFHHILQAGKFISVLDLYVNTQINNEQNIFAVFPISVRKMVKYELLTINTRVCIFLWERFVTSALKFHIGFCNTKVPSYQVHETKLLIFTLSTLSCWRYWHGSKPFLVISKFSTNTQV